MLDILLREYYNALSVLDATPPQRPTKPPELVHRGGEECSVRVQGQELAQVDPAVCDIGRRLNIQVIEPLSESETRVAFPAALAVLLHLWYPAMKRNSKERQPTLVMIH